MNALRRSRFEKGLGYMGYLALVLALAACLVCESPLLAENDDDQILATLGGKPITRSQVEEAVAGELLRIDRERHQALEKGLAGVVDQRLIELEAEARGLTVAELGEKEVEEKITPPTDAEVDAFYEERKAQIRQPKDQVAQKIRELLTFQRQEEIRAQFLSELKKKYVFESFFEPLRMNVATSGFPAKGLASAPVTIVEFSDFQCPYCSRVVPTLERVAEEYGDRVRIVFRQFPLTSIHPLAQKAAEASLCAADQDKFWEMHDTMFQDQSNLQVDKLKEKAASLGLDSEVFNGCIDSSKYAEKVAEDLQEGSRAGVTGTPAVFINGRFLSGAQPFETFAQIIEEELESVAASPSS